MPPSDAPLAGVLLPFVPTGADAAAIQRFMAVADGRRQPPSLPAAFPRDRLPYWFMGRWALLGQVARHLEQWDQLRGPLLLTGPGGSGKTALAAHSMVRRRHAYDQLCWITVADAATAVADLGRLAHDPDRQEVDDNPQRPALAHAAGGTLGQLRRCRLLVIDHFADLPPDPTVVTAVEQLQRGYPDLRVLVTARQDAGWPQATPIAVGPLAPSDAVEFLRQRTGTPAAASVHDPAMTLAAELGYHPGALEQAGDYIDKCGITLDSFRRLLGAAKTTGHDLLEPAQRHAAGELVWVPAEHQVGTVNAFSGTRYIVSLVCGEVRVFLPDQLEPWADAQPPTPA